MKIGAVFPNFEIAARPDVIKELVKGIDSLQFDHLLTYDHVLGVDPERHPKWEGPLSVDDPVHEPFVLLGFVAALTKLELATGILILPQRQTALVAKQAAQLDLLCGGRLRLGIGLGWNELEYQALGKTWHDRGRRVNEQIALLRDLWTQRSVRFEGAFEEVDGAGISPRSIQRPIPIWLAARPLLKPLARVGNLADGWIPRMGLGTDLDYSLDVIAEAAVSAGRDPSQVGMEGRIDVDKSDIERAVDEAHAWQARGATHVSFNTMGNGETEAMGYLRLLEKVRSSMGGAGL